MLELLSCDVLLRQQLSSVSYILIVHSYIHYTLHKDFCAYVYTHVIQPEAIDCILVK